MLLYFGDRGGRFPFVRCARGAGCARGARVVRYALKLCVLQVVSDRNGILHTRDREGSAACALNVMIF